MGILLGALACLNYSFFCCFQTSQRDCIILGMLGKLWGFVPTVFTIILTCQGQFGSLVVDEPLCLSCYYSPLACPDSPSNAHPKVEGSLLLVLVLSENGTLGVSTVWWG